MAEEASSTIDPGSDLLVVTRLFDAPRDLVFEAWTRPEHLEKWWGPRGFTTTTHAFEFAVGGGWRLTMHGPDGVDYPNRLVYREIVRPERIVYAHHGGDDDSGVDFTSTITFDVEGDRTRVTMSARFPSAAVRDATIERYGAAEGAKQTLGRLAEQVAARRTTAAGLTITRVFDAPRSRVFAAFAEPEELAKWFGPRGFTMASCEVDLRPGGVFRFTFRGPDGKEYPFEGEFRDVVPGRRIVYAGNIEEGLGVHTTLTFDDRDGKTLLVVHQDHTRESDATRGAAEGWKQTLDRLAEHLG